MNTANIFFNSLKFSDFYMYKVLKDKCKKVAYLYITIIFFNQSIIYFNLHVVYSRNSTDEFYKKINKKIRIIFVVIINVPVSNY